MTWGAFYMYYECPECGKKFKSEEGLIADLGEKFGKCPVCGTLGKLVHEGAIPKDDLEFEEIDE